MDSRSAAVNSSQSNYRQNTGYIGCICLTVTVALSILLVVLVVYINVIFPTDGIESEMPRKKAFIFAPASPRPTTSTSTTTTTTTTTTSRPTTKLTTTVGPKEEYSISAALDKSVDPCTDFYRYACGRVIKSQVQNRIEFNDHLLESSILEIIKSNLSEEHLSIERFKKCVNVQQDNIKRNHPAVINYDNVLAFAILNRYNLLEKSRNVIKESKKTLIKLVSNSNWMDDAVKEKIIQSIGDSWFHLGMPSKYADWKVLDTIYQNKSECKRKSFLEDFYFKVELRKMFGKHFWGGSELVLITLNSQT